MDRTEREETRQLNSVSRRAFFRDGIRAALGLGAIAGLVASSAGCDYDDGVCGYCDGCSRNYYHCDGMYCDYLNYPDGC